MSQRATMRWRTEREADAVSRLDPSYISPQADAVHRSGTSRQGEVAVFMAHLIDGDARG